MFVWALSASPSPLFQGVWLHRLRATLHLRQELSLIESFEKPCQRLPAFSRELHSSCSSQPFTCLSYAAVMSMPSPVPTWTWPTDLSVQLDLRPASWLWMGLATSGLLTDPSYHHETKSPPWYADQTFWLDLRLHHYRLVICAGWFWLLPPDLLRSPCSGIVRPHL